MVLAAAEAGCVREVVVIAAGLTIQDPRERPEAERGRADAAHARFADKRSDFVTLLNLWEHIREVRSGTSANGLRRACREQYLNYLRIREWQDLVGAAPRGARRPGHRAGAARPRTATRIHRALLTGMLSQVGMWDPLRRDYLGARGARFVIFPGSALARTNPEWVMSSRAGRDLAAVRPAQRRDQAGVDRGGRRRTWCRRSYSEPHWSAKRGATVAIERVTLYGIPLVAGRHGRLRPHRPGALPASCSSAAALVEGDWRTRHRFWHANRERAAGGRRSSRSAAGAAGW